MKTQRILTIFRMEMKKMLRNPLLLFFTLFFSALLIAIFGLTLGNNYGWGPELSIFEHMVPGLFAYSGVLTTMHVAVSVTSDRAEGVQRRINTTPITSGELIGGQMLSYTIIPLIQTAVMLLTALLVGYRPFITAGGVALVFVFMIFLTFVSVGFGMICAIIAKKPDTASSLAFIFIVPQQLFGTFIYMGEAAEAVNPFMPSWYPTDAIYRMFNEGQPLTTLEIWRDLGVIVLLAIIIYVIGIKLYDRYKNKNV